MSLKDSIIWIFEHENDDGDAIYTFSNPEALLPLDPWTLEENRTRGTYVITGRFGKVVEEGVL